MTQLKTFSKVVALVKTTVRTDKIIRIASVEHPAYSRLSERMIQLLYARGERELERISGINVASSDSSRLKKEPRCEQP
jgi:hypothetical protein